MPRPAFAGLQLAERERPATVHHSLHESREAAATRIDRHQTFDVDRVFNPTSLRAPEPRNGFAQRWVADGTAPNADRAEQRNWFAKRQVGWQPRDPESVPHELRHLYPSIKLSDGQTAIRIASQVLCEIPLAVLRERHAAVRARIDHQSASVPDSAKDLHTRGRRGVTPMEVVDQTRSIRGRRAPSLSDADLRDII